MKKQSLRVVCDTQAKEALEKESAMVVYFVKNGDTIWDIGKNYHIRREKILEANNLEENIEVIPGEKLILPLA